MIKPKENCVAVKPIFWIENPNDSSGMNDIIGHVLSVSGARLKEFGIKEGDCVLFNSTAGRALSYKGKPMLLVEDDSIIITLSDIDAFIIGAREAGFKVHNLKDEE